MHVELTKPMLSAGRGSFEDVSRPRSGLPSKYGLKNMRLKTALFGLMTVSIDQSGSRVKHNCQSRSMATRFSDEKE